MRIGSVFQSSLIGGHFIRLSSLVEECESHSGATRYRDMVVEFNS